MQKISRKFYHSQDIGYKSWYLYLINKIWFVPYYRVKLCRPGMTKPDMVTTNDMIPVNTMPKHTPGRSASILYEIFRTHFSEWCLGNFLWKCTQVNVASELKPWFIFCPILEKNDCVTKRFGCMVLWPVKPSLNCLPPAQYINIYSSSQGGLHVWTTAS